MSKEELKEVDKLIEGMSKCTTTTPDEIFKRCPQYHRYDLTDKQLKEIIAKTIIETNKNLPKEIIENLPEAVVKQMKNQFIMEVGYFAISKLSFFFGMVIVALCAWAISTGIIKFS